MNLLNISLEPMISCSEHGLEDMSKKINIVGVAETQDRRRRSQMEVVRDEIK